MDATSCMWGLSVFAIKFDKNGIVQEENIYGEALIGKFTQHGAAVLAIIDGSDTPPYELGKQFWSTVGGRDALFSPRICSYDDEQRYKKGFRSNPSPSSGNFGCREWAYQLLKSEQPYIDITSYESKDARIKNTNGWSHFDSPPKPIIGKHERTWVCLYECPEGTTPGIIPNIVKWAKKYGFPLPQRPQKNPMFPDVDSSFNYNELPYAQVVSEAAKYTLHGMLSK